MVSYSKYELLKCDKCGKKLGYVLETVRINPPRLVLRLTKGVSQKVSKTAFCEECFLRRKAEIAKSE